MFSTKAKDVSKVKAKKKRHTMYTSLKIGKTD